MASKRRALTLVELTLVILIMGILAAISMPRISESLLAARLRATVTAVQSHVRHARAVAINQGRTVTITFDNALDRYESGEAGFPDQPGSRLAVSVHEHFDPAIDLLADFDGASTLSFDAEGVPRVAGDVLTSGYIELSSGGVRHRIRVDPGLGIVSSSQISGR